MLRRFSLAAVFCGLLVTGSVVHANTRDEVHLLQNFLRDATVVDQGAFEPFLGYGDFDGGSVFQFGGRGVIPVAPRFLLGGQVAFASISPDRGDGESGLTDLLVSGRYNFPIRSATQFSAGGELSLPIGSEDIGYGNFDLGFFGAVRHPSSQNVVLTGTLGMISAERGDDRDMSLEIGGGLIYAPRQDLSWVFELELATEGDYALLSAGIDYDLRTAGRLRGSLGFGLDDGAPDIQLIGAYLFGQK